MSFWYEDLHHDTEVINASFGTLQVKRNETKNKRINDVHTIVYYYYYYNFFFF